MRTSSVLQWILWCCGWAALLCGVVPGQERARWTVRPEWVKAHEDFLASDAMRGRGSATHDEEVTATYIASEFEGYGLKPAPGETGYLQSAEVEQPALDGRASLSGVGLSAVQGADFDLMRSTGSDVSGPLAKLTDAQVRSSHVEHGAAVLLSQVGDLSSVSELIGTLQGKGAGMVLLPAEGTMAGLFTMMGGQTRLPVHLVGSTMDSSGLTVVLLHGGTLKALEGVANGEVVHLGVHQVPSAPRSTYNAVAYLPGTDPSAGTILLSAHLDHLGVSRPVNGDAIYNGANDDAAGTTAVLELAHALTAGPPLRRSVLFVCYGSEEIGELGSTYFGEHPPVPLKQLVANLEFEMIGNQDPKMPKGVLLLTGWDRSNLGPMLRQHGALLGPDPYPEEHFFERSDNYSLALKGVVAHTAAGWGTPPTYHQPNDDLQHLDLPFMTAAIQSLVEPVRWLASSDFVPKWNAGGQPKER